MNRFGIKFLALSKSEWNRFLYTWSLKTLLKMAFIVGWIAFITLFVTRYSISQLSILFFTQALLTILSMYLFSKVTSSFKSKNLVIFNAFLIAFILFISTFIFEFDQSIFFMLLFLAYGIFFSQLNLILSNFIEDFFTPLEAEKLFPMLESADTIGIMTAGAFVACFADLFSV